VTSLPMLMRLTSFSTCGGTAVYTQDAAYLLFHYFTSAADAAAAVEARIRIGWNTFRQLVPLFTNNDVSLIMRGRLYSSCVHSNSVSINDSFR